VGINGYDIAAALEDGSGELGAEAASCTSHCLILVLLRKLPRESSEQLAYDCSVVEGEEARGGGGEVRGFCV
jgi:hypothetical protein